MAWARLTFLVLAAPTAGWRASIAALAVVGLAGFAGQSDDGDRSRDGGPLVRIVQPNVAASREVAAGEPRARSLPSWWS